MHHPTYEPPGQRNPNGGQRLGGWMIVTAWLLILLLLTALFSGWLDRLDNPNRVLQVQSGENGESTIVLERNRAGHYVAPGMINGVAVTFLLDTGATNLALPKALADRIGLQRGAMGMSSTANGYVRSWLTRLDRVELGPFVLQDVQASILPTMPGDEVLLGMNFLKHLELIQKGNELIIRAPRT